MVSSKNGFFKFIFDSAKYSNQSKESLVYCDMSTQHLSTLSEYYYNDVRPYWELNLIEYAWLSNNWMNITEMWALLLFANIKDLMD